MAALCGAWLLGACGGRSDRTENGTAGTGAAGGTAPTGVGGTGPVIAQLEAECQTLDADETSALEDARACDPSAAANPCTARLDSGRACDCIAFVNPANADAVARVKSAAQEFQDLGCQGFYGACGVCANAVSGVCDPSGRCETIFGDGPVTGSGGMPSGGSGGAGAAGRGGAGAGGSAGAANGGASGSNAGAANGGDAGAGGSETSVDCRAESEANARAFEDALECDPNATDPQCTGMATQGAGCGCLVYVNSENLEAIAQLRSTQQAYQAGGCATGVECGACLAPIRAECGADSRCQQVYPGTGRSCKVSGVVYADGENDIPSPVDVCNTCTCYDGLLACTEVGCDEKPCPEGQTYGQACAQCGATDACELPEYDCFWPCSAGCADRNLYCVNDMCVETACR